MTPVATTGEGPGFHPLSPPRLQVATRHSPEDRKAPVSTLRPRGETAGVTGSGTNDGPILKATNIGLPMGIASYDVVEEASNIIPMGDNSASIIKAIVWAGRCVNDVIRKSLQFQISTNVIITFVASTTPFTSSCSSRSQPISPPSSSPSYLPLLQPRGSLF
jgi:P-type E1-E2 ATPase